MEVLTVGKYLWIAGTLPFIILGTIHLLYTFFTNKFSSGNNQLDDMMKASHPVLTKKITMWKAWIGFNASHSSGIMFIGLINLFVAVQYAEVLQNPAYLLFNNITVLFYLWLGKKYWFSTPFRGILITAICFISSSLIILL